MTPKNTQKGNFSLSSLLGGFFGAIFSEEDEEKLFNHSRSWSISVNSDVLSRSTACDAFSSGETELLVEISLVICEWKNQCQSVIWYFLPLENGKAFFSANHISTQIKTSTSAFCNCSTHELLMEYVAVVDWQRLKKAQMEKKCSAHNFPPFSWFFLQFSRMMFFTFSPFHSTIFTSRERFSDTSNGLESRWQGLIVTFNLKTKQS